MEGKETKNMSPAALREYGLLKRFGYQAWCTGDVFDDDDIDPEAYAYEGQVIHQGTDQDLGRDVRNECALYRHHLPNKNNLLHKIRHINPRRNDKNHGINVYLHCLSALGEF